MKKPSDNLFQLIKSLTMPEKRYFKIYVNAIIRAKFYAPLFDAIDHQKVYDEKKLVKQLEKKGGSKELAIRKNQLYNLILKILVDFHKEKTANMRIRGLLDQIEILILKKQYDSALKLVNKARKVCLSHELFVFQLHLQEVEFLIHSTTKNIDWLENNSASSYKVTEQLLSTYKNLISYVHLSGELLINGVKKFRGFKAKDEKTYEEIMKHELMTDENKAISNRAKSYFFRVAQLTSFMMHKNNDALNFAQKGRSIYEENTWLIEEKDSFYLSSLNNILSFGKEILSKEELLETLNVIKDLSKNKSTNKRSLVRYYHKSLIIYYQHGDYDYLLRFIENEIIPFVETCSEELMDSQLYSLCYAIGCFYFIIGEVKKAIFWLNKTENNVISRNNNSQRLVNTVRILFHAELENWTLVNSLTRSSHRKGTISGDVLDFEKLMFSFFKNTYPTVFHNKKKRIEAFMELKGNLMKLLNKHRYQDIDQVFDFIAWCDSKIENKPLIEILKRKARKG